MSDKERAERVARLLNDPDLNQAFEDVRQALFQRFLQADVEDASTLRELKHMHTLLASVEANLRQAIQDGTLENFNIQQAERMPHLGDIKSWMKSKRHQA